MPPEKGYRLPLPGKVYLENGWLLKCEPVALKDINEIKANKDRSNHAWLDADLLDFPLTIRTRRSGDRFQPLGMDGKSVKLSDFWVNAKLPYRARNSWPLVCSGESIVWVPGFRLGHSFQLSETTRQAVHLRLSQGE